MTYQCSRKPHPSSGGYSRVGFEETAVHSNREQSLWEKVEDLEYRSRCNNLRLVGLQESIPPGDLLSLCETELPQDLGISRHCKVERADRVGPDFRDSERQTNQPRQQVIMCFLDYKDREAILKDFKAQKEPVTIRGDAHSPVWGLLGGHNQEA